MVTLISGINHLIKTSCIKQAAIMGVDYRYGLFEECLVKSERGFVPIQQYIYDITEEHG